MRARYFRYLRFFAVPLILLLPAGLANLAFLANTGELTPIEEVAAIQQARGGLYGTALFANGYAYSLALYRVREPDIVAIGSSRVLQFRQAQFTRPFFNLGRTVNYPADAVKLVGDMLAIHRPKVAIFGIDHYWLNRAYTAAPDFRQENQGAKLSPDALLSPFRWLVSGKIDWPTYLAFVFGHVPTGPDGSALTGVQAIIDGTGNGSDGSRYYDHFIFGRRPTDDIGFRDTLQRVATGNKQFRFGRQINLDAFEDLQKTIALLRNAGVHVITFVPPVAGSVLNAMRKAGDKFAYVPRAQDILSRLGTMHGDFLDGAQIGISDCEFIDGFHVGEVGAARILAALNRRYRSTLADSVNEQVLERMIERYAGKATADLRFKRDHEQEVDFLELGCLK